MKLKALTLGVAMAFPLLASAQGTGTSVTLYGVVDTGIEYVNNIGVDKNSSFHMPNLTASGPSLWGLRGTEDLGNGLSAIFTLESGFNPNTGTSGQGGRLFGRQAFVGLKGDWGQVAFGRQYNMLNIGLRSVDIMGPNAYGLGSLDTYIPNARMDNSITYLGKFSGFQVGLAYARGRDTQTTGGPGATNCGVDYSSQSACSAWGATLGYDAANWGVTAVYDVIKGRDGANFYGLGASDQDRRLGGGAYVKFDDLKVSLLYINRKTDSVIGARLGDRSDLWSLAASYNVSPAVTLDGSVNYIRFGNADESSRAMYYVARARYNFSKRTSAYAMASFMNNSGLSALSAAGGTAGANPAAGNNQTALMVGLRHAF